MRKLALFLLGALVCLSPLQAQQRPKILVIEQRSNGFPGAQKRQASGKGVPLLPQLIFLHKDRLRIEDMVSRGLTRVVRLDKEKVWELWSATKKDHYYTETPFSKYRDWFKKEERKRARIKLQISNAPNMKESRRKELYLKHGFDPDGGDDVFTLTRTGEKKKLNGFNTERWVIKRNKEILLDVWTDKTRTSPPVLFRIYRSLGVLPEEVVSRTRKIPGFPIRLRVIIDLGIKGRYDLTNEVRKISYTSLRPLSIFDLPKTHKKYKPAKPAKQCPVCRKKLKKGTKTYRFVWRRVRYYCCSKKHRRKWMKHCVKHLRK